MAKAKDREQPADDPRPAKRRGGRKRTLSDNPLERLVAEPGVDPVAADSPARMVPLYRIEVGDVNPRTTFAEEPMELLARSIAASGLVQALVVQPGEADGEYLLVAGERRYRALQRLVEAGELAREVEVPVFVTDRLPPRDALLRAVTENVAREDLSPLDEGAAYARLRDEFDVPTAEIAEIVGRTQRHVQGRIALAALHPDVQEALRADRIPVTAARVLTQAPPELQADALREFLGAPKSLQVVDRLEHFLLSSTLREQAALFPVEDYEGEFYVGEDGTRYFADRAEFMKLQKAALAKLQRQLEAEFEWVDEVTGRTLPSGYRRTGAGPGAVIWYRAGLADVEILRNVERERSPSGAETAPPSDAPTTGGAGEGAAAPAATGDEEPKAVRAPRASATGRLAQVTRRLRAAFEGRVAAADERTALALAILDELLAPSAAEGDRDVAPEVSSILERAAERLDALVYEPGSGLHVSAEPIGRGTAGREVLSALREWPEEDLRELHRALLARRLAARLFPGAATSGQPRPLPALTSELVEELDAHEAWRPDAAYLAELTRDALLDLANDAGVDLPRNPSKADIVGRLLESSALGDHSPEELDYLLGR